MRPEQRHLWLLPWFDERNAFACAAQVCLGQVSHRDFDRGAVAAGNADVREKTIAAAHLMNAWHQKPPGEHDKTMLDALEHNTVGVMYSMSLIMSTALAVTKRALNNNLASNAENIRSMMDTVMYSQGASEFINDAMAKWRFYDATGRRKMDDELRAAFEAYWIAGEYAAGYEFVGAQWPKEWDFGYIEFSTSMTYIHMGLLKRDVQ